MGPGEWPQLTLLAPQVPLPGAPGAQRRKQAAGVLCHSKGDPRSTVPAGTGTQQQNGTLSHKSEGPELGCPLLHGEKWKTTTSISLQMTSFFSMSKIY